MSDDDVKAIAAALDKWTAYWSITFIDPIEILNTEIPEDIDELFTEQSAAWTTALLQERERLVLKIECLENHMDDHAITAAVHEYEQALAALDAGQEAG